MIVLTRNQLEKLSKEELIHELLTVNSIQEELANLTSRSKEFLEMCVCNLKKTSKNYQKITPSLFQNRLKYYKEIFWTCCNTFRWK